MIQMDIDPFVNVRAMIEWLRKTLPDRKFIDRNIWDYVRIRGQQKKLELDSVNIVIDPNFFDPTYITSYKDTSDNYSKGEYLLH